MSVDKLLKNVSKQFQEFKLKEGFEILHQINIQYPSNVKVHEFFEKNKKQKQNNLLIKLPEIVKLQSKKNNAEKLNSINTFLKIDSQNPYLLALLGNLYRETSNYEKSKEFYQKAIFLNPYEEIFYINFSSILNHLSQFDYSLLILNFAKIINPADINIDILLARNFARALKFEECYEKFEYIISQETNSDKYKIEYSNLLLKNNNIQKATNIIDSIKIKNENKTEVLLLRGILKLKEKSFIEAKDFFEKASRLNTNISRPYTFLGIAYKNLLDFENAIKSHLQALKIDKKNYISLHNLGVIYAIMGKIKKSICHFKEVISINPNYHESRYLLGQLQIMNKDFKEGWINFKSRWHFHKYPHKKLVTNKPLLKKLDKNINLCIWKEQGIGDQIMYGSMFKELAERVSNLIILIDKRLIKVFVKNHPKIKFISSIDEVSDENYDFHMPFGNIGLFLRNKDTDFYKSNFPYASSNSRLTSLLKKKYRHKNKIVIGISWSSSNQILGDTKSIAIENFKPIFSISNLTFIDLQYINSEDDRKYVLKNYNVKIHNEIDIDKYNDLESLASLIEVCDFIITCSNINAHLAGALNKKTYLLLPLGKGRLWNWSEKNYKSVWYPSVKIFQQKYNEDWVYPIKQIEQEILKCQNV